jgi:dTDP-4-dehydrorhamnose 3,5-epimerase
MAPGFAHGFCVLSEAADVHYKVSRLFDPADEGGVLCNDSDLGIDWPIERPRLSARDANYPRLSEITRGRLPHVGRA